MEYVAVKGFGAIGNPVARVSYTKELNVVGMAASLQRWTGVVWSGRQRTPFGGSVAPTLTALTQSTSDRGSSFIYKTMRARPDIKRDH